jgi:histidine triad (HIT) family protein
VNVDCVFCKIAEGRMPATRVYEDADVLAFLDIGPIVKGHVLVVPRAHYDPITSVPPETLARMMRVVQRVAAALVEGLGADGVNLFQANGAAAGQVVPHVHVHVIPRYNDDGHHWNWTSSTYADAEEMQRVADRVAAAVRRG